MFRGQGQGLELLGQSQELQNVSSKSRMSSRTPPLINMYANEHESVRKVVIYPVIYQNLEVSKDCYVMAVDNALYYF